MRLIFLGIVLIGTPAMADGFYAGGTFTAGTSQSLAPDYGPFSPPAIGVIAGREFDFGEFYFSPEIGARVGVVEKQVMSYENDLWPMSQSVREEIRELGSFSASAIVGRRFGQFALFAKAGMGMAFLRDQTTIEFVGTDETMIRSPVVAGSIGAQYNFERHFIRVEAEVRHFAKPDYYDLDQINVTGTAGIRF